MNKVCIMIMLLASKGTYRTFTAGEITPDLYGRTDVQEIYSGARVIENMFVWPHGPVEKRAGTKFVEAIDITGTTTTTRIGEYPTLQALTAVEIPSKPSERADTAQAGAQAITNKTELQAIAGPNDYYLSNDINAVGAWTPIASYSGVLDGNDFTISNLTINATASDFQGMFASFATGAEIWSLTFQDCNVISDDDSGILLGGQNGADTVKIRDVNFIDCYLNGGQDLGCLIGAATNGEGWQIWRCTVSGDTTVISDSRSVGGLIGDLDSPTGDIVINMVVDCSNTSTSYVQGDNEGGLIGTITGGARASRDEAKVHTCYSTCEVARNTTNDSGAGGLIGIATSTDITTCYATGDLTSVMASNTPLAIGGFVGFDGGWNTIINCYSTGDVTTYGTVARVGGFCGKSDQTDSIFRRCYSTGDVSHFKDTVGDFDNYWGVGGFIGAFHQSSADPNNGLVERCWCTGDVTIEFGASGEGVFGCVGGFLGQVYLIGPTIRDCYAWGSVLATDADVENGFGGFVGGLTDVGGSTIDADVNMVNCYCAQTDTAAGSGFTNQITDDPNSGGFSGYESNAGSYEVNDVNDGNIVCFWDTETSGLSSSISGTGHLTAWMQTQASYADVGWNFGTIWVLTETVTTVPGPLGLTDPTIPPARLIAFVGATASPLIIEAGEKYLRFYKDGP